MSDMRRNDGINDDGLLPEDKAVCCGLGSNDCLSAVECFRCLRECKSRSRTFNRSGLYPTWVTYFFHQSPVASIDTSGKAVYAQSGENARRCHQLQLVSKAESDAA